MDEMAGSVGKGREQSGLVKASGSENQKFLHSQRSLTDITIAKAYKCVFI